MKLRNKNMLVDFYYRNWLFLLVSFLLLDPSPLTINCQPITVSSNSISYHPSSHIHPSPPSPSSICPHLVDNFRFDFALNEHIAIRHANYRHYLVSKHNFIKFELPNDNVQLTGPLPLVNQSLIDTIDYDLGFSLLTETEGVTKLCFLKLRPGTLKCLTLDQYEIKPLSDPSTFRDILPDHRFPLAPDFLPTVAFADVRFADYENSRHQVLFIEQTLDKEKSNSTMRKFNRRIEGYLFNLSTDGGFLRTVNLTSSLFLPEYLESIPESLELTGIFNWKKGNGDHEYLMLAFNGSSHLYCLNGACAKESGWKPWLEYCKPEAKVLKEAKENKDNLGYLWGINHHPKYEDSSGKGSSIIDYITSEGLMSSKNPRSYSLYLLSGMFFLIVCLILLILGVCYYSVKEVSLQEKQTKVVYEKAVLLAQINSAKQKVALAEEGNVIDNHQDTTVSSSSFTSTTSSNFTPTYLNSSTPEPLVILPEMRRIPIEAVLVSKKSTVNSQIIKTNDTSGPPKQAPAVRQFSSAV